MTAEEHLDYAVQEIGDDNELAATHAFIAIAKFLQRLAPSGTIVNLPAGPERIVRSF